MSTDGEQDFINARMAESRALSIEISQSCNDIHPAVVVAACMRVALGAVGLAHPEQVPILVDLMKTRQIPQSNFLKRYGKKMATQNTEDSTQKVQSMLETTDELIRKIAKVSNGYEAPIVIAACSDLIRLVIDILPKSLASPSLDYLKKAVSIMEQKLKDEDQPMH